MDENGCRPLFVICHFIHSLFKKRQKTQSSPPFHVWVLTMLKHKHELEVLVEDRWIYVQDENLPMCVSLSSSQLCITMSDDKAAMNSLSRRKITISCLHNFIILGIVISNLIYLQLILFDLLVNLQRNTEFDSLRIELSDCSLVSQVKLQLTLWHR